VVVSYIFIGAPIVVRTPIDAALP